VFVGAALVAVSFDEDEHVLVGLQPGRVGVEHLRVGRANVVLVEVEEDIFQVGDRREVTRSRARTTSRTRRGRRGASSSGLHAGGAAATGAARSARASRRPGRPGDARRCRCRRCDRRGTLRAARHHDDQHQEGYDTANATTGEHDASLSMMHGWKPAPLQSYHGSRGDQEGLVDYVEPRVMAIASDDPSASTAYRLNAPRRFDWNTRWRPLGAHAAP